MDLENAEEILQILERYTKQKSKTIPDELNGYLTHVALTGDSVYTWSKVQYFFREKLAHVLKDFHDTTPRTEDLPVSRNVDTFNYDTMKTTLLERFDLFHAAPFTIQRLSELLNEPKKHYCRLDKYMRALEKNILVVSTVEPGHRQMGSENGDSINGDPLMDINVDVEMDKEPSSSCVPPTEKKSSEAEPEPDMDDTSTQNKTEQGTSEQCEESISDDVKVDTNGHHNDGNDVDDELNDTVEDLKDDDEEEIVDSADKTDDSSPSVETVEVQLVELAEKVNSPEVSTVVDQPISEASPVTSEIDQPKEVSSEPEQLADDEKQASEAESSVELPVKKDENEIIAEKKSENVTEGTKHSLDQDGDDEECQPTAAKLAKIDESLTSVEPVVVPETKQVDEIPSEETVTEDPQTTEVKETLSESVLQEDIGTTQPARLDDQPVVDEQIVVAVVASTDDDKSTIVDSRLDVDVITSAIPSEIPSEPVPEPVTIDDTKTDTISSDNAISPLASTISNDLDILEAEEEELIEPIIADAEQNIPEPSALAETDVEMTPTVDNAEQMAVEDPTPVLPSTNSDLAMDATQIIPSTTSDEQMDVFENNSMDEDL